MKLQLKKQSLINLSQDAKLLPNELTPQIGGGKADAQSSYVTYNCPVSDACPTNTDDVRCATLNTNAHQYGMHCY